MVRKAFFSLLLACATGCGPVAPVLAAPADGSAAATPDDYILLTVFLRHDQSKTLDQIKRQLEDGAFWTAFPPPGIAVESWYVMMGVGQVVTLRVPPGRLREVNLAVEKHAWGAFRTEFYPTYDFRRIAERMRSQHADRL